MEIKQNYAQLIATHIVKTLECYDVEVLIERDDSTKIMTTWSMYISYYHHQRDSASLTLKRAFVIDNATGDKLHRVYLSDEEKATLEEYVSLEYDIDSTSIHI